MEKPEKVCDILIVDDNEPSRLLIAHVISQQLNADITLAESGERALQLANERSYDLILLDLLMPEIGGLEVLKRIRTGSANRSTPIIIVSVRGTSIMVGEESVSIDRAESLGANAVVFKPFTHRELISAVKTQLEKKA